MEVRVTDPASDRIKKWNGKTTWTGRASLYKQLHAGDLIAMEACSLAFVIARAGKSES